MSIRRLVPADCSWPEEGGCERAGDWVVTGVIGIFCRPHALETDRKLLAESALRDRCAWYKGCTVAGRSEVFDVDGTSLGLFCMRHTGAQERRVARRRSWTAVDEGGEAD